MFCSIHKLLISRAVDSKKQIPAFTKRHLGWCDSCQEFAQLCGSLKQRFTHDTSAILKGYNKAIDQKVISALPEIKESRSTLSRPGLVSNLFSKRTFLVPSLVAASLVMVISISILFLTLPRSKEVNSLANISDIFNRAHPALILEKAESPLEKEYIELKETIESTAKFLISRLDVRLGQ